MTTTVETTSILQHNGYLVRLVQQGITALPPLLTLSALGATLEEAGYLADGEATLALSRWDISKLTGLSCPQVQRALTWLVENDFIVRKQSAKREGEIALTLLTPKALTALGLSIGVKVSHPIPKELTALLLGESLTVINAVVSAWDQADLTTVEIEREFRGGARAWEQIRFFLESRLEVKHQQVEAAIEHAEAEARPEERGEYPLALPSGESVTLSVQAFRASTRTGLFKLVDLKFVRDAIAHLCIRHPDMVTRATLPKLIAEVAYSRVAGFVMTHDAMSAIRVLASCISKPTWSKPRKMDECWYDVATTVVCAQGDRFCVAN